jgi:hypothetical protein
LLVILVLALRTKPIVHRIPLSFLANGLEMLVCKRRT